MKSLFKQLTLFLVLSQICVSNPLLGQYPYTPQTSQTLINGTVGELRGSGSRYHLGLDMAKADGTNVYCMQTGPLRKRNNAGFAVGTYGYVHVIPNTANVANKANGTIITEGTLIGTVTDGHVHLQESGTNISNGSSTQSNLSGWEAQNNIDWINPILGLNPTDNQAPEIDEITLYRQGTNTEITDQLDLYGKIDLYMDCEDQGINPSGSGNSGWNLAPMTAKFDILNDASNVLFDEIGIDFSDVPDNASAETIFHSTATSGNWVASLTKDAFNTPYNKYWNSRQTMGGAWNVSSDIPNNTYESERLWFLAEACDESGCDDAYIPPGLDYYVVDNFMPFITSFSLGSNLPIAGNNQIFYHTRVQDENGTSLNNGLVVNDEFGFDNSLSAFTVYPTVVMSEPMEEVSMRFIEDGGVWSDWENMNQDGPNRKVWTSIIDGYMDGCILFNFKGTDRSGNDIINVYEMTNQNALGESVLIPTRSGDTEWNNEPAIVGEDYFASCTDCANLINGLRGFQIMDKSVTDCSDIEDFDINIWSDCNGFGTEIELVGFNTDKYDIGWADLNGIYQLGGPIHVVNGPGEYCFRIESLDGCCAFEDCIEVGSYFSESFDVDFGPGFPSQYSTITISTASNPAIAYPLTIKYIDSNGDQVCGTTSISFPSSISSCDELEIGEDYCVVIVDANGCESQYCFTVEGETCPGNLGVNLEEMTQECGDDTGGSIGIAIDQGDCLNDFSVSWSNGDQGTTASDLGAGTYCVTVKGGVGCEDCKTVKCFEIESVDEDDCEECNADPITLLVTKTNSCYCPGEPPFGGVFNLPTVSISISGGLNNQVSVTNQFSGSITPNIGPNGGLLTSGNNLWGETCVTVTDECGNSVTHCVTVPLVVYLLQPPCFKKIRKGIIGPVYDHEAIYAFTSKGKFIREKYLSIDKTWEWTRYDGIANELMRSQVPGKQDLAYLITDKLNGTSNHIHFLSESRLDKAILEGKAEISLEALRDNQLDKVSDFVVHPNPFSSNLTVRFESAITGKAQMKIYNVLGAEFHTETVEVHTGHNEFTISSLDNLSTGMYLLNLSIQDLQIYTKKIIKN